MGGRPIQQQNPYQAVPNRPTYGDLTFGSSGVPPNSAYRIALATNRLQKNIFGDGYSEFMEYGAIDAFPNPRYGTAAGMPTGPTGRPEDANVDLYAENGRCATKSVRPETKESRANIYTSFPRMVQQGRFAAQGETSCRLHKVLWAR
jgi:hypothetical protein